MSCPAVVLLLALGWACNAAPQPTAPSVAPATTPGGPTVYQYQVSGRVIDEAGSPIAGIFVEVDYQNAGGPTTSTPRSTCPSYTGNWCWLKTTTDSTGSFEARLQSPVDNQYQGQVGYAYSYAEGFETQIQLLPKGSPGITTDLRLRRVHSITAGESATLSVEDDSTRCSDLEDLWVMGSRCEIIRITAPAGTLVVEARPVDPGGPVPSVFWATTGDYAGSIPAPPSPGVVSIPIRGGTYQIFVGIPNGTASQRFEVMTSLR